VHVFEDSVAQQEFYSKTVGPLAPGRYELSVVIKTAGATNESAIAKRVDFVVN
jgi:hypothetical protein